jgi:hypothetical protein
MGLPFDINDSEVTVLAVMPDVNCIYKNQIGTIKAMTRNMNNLHVLQMKP